MCAADYFVYYPVETPRWLIGTLTHIGIFLGILISEIIGIGLALGAVKDGAWKDALDQGAGTLMVEAFKPLGEFGKVCAVVLALGPSKLIIYIGGGKACEKSVQCAVVAG